MRWLALILLLQGPGSASPMVLLRGVIETQASTAADGKAQTYSAGGLQGALRFDATRITPDGSCRSFILTASDAPAGPFTHFTGEACLAPGGSRWRAVRLQPAQTAAPHPPSGLPVIVSPPPHPGPGPIVIPPRMHARPMSGSMHMHHSRSAVLPPPSRPPVDTGSPEPKVAQAPPSGTPAARPPPETATPTATAVATAAVDPASTLRTLPIVYNRPKILEFDSDTPMSLVIDVTGRGAEVLKELPGEPVSAKVQLDQWVSARLTSDPAAVRITGRQKDEQRLSRRGNVVWSWDLRALTPKATTVTLQLFTRPLKSAPDDAETVQTYIDNFTVHVDAVARFRLWLDTLNPILKALGLGTPVVVAAAILTFFRKSLGRLIARKGPAP